MRKKKVLFIGMGLAATAGLIIGLSLKKNKDDYEDRLHQVSEEGYETAHDVLYPLKIKRLKNNRIS